MAKKPRSQQRKKGQTMGADGSEEGGANGGGAGNSNAEFLAEDHTVADSSVASASQFDDDFAGMLMYDDDDIYIY
jgi:hypothetical protein